MLRLLGPVLTSSCNGHETISRPLRLRTFCWNMRLVHDCDMTKADPISPTDARIATRPANELIYLDDGQNGEGSQVPKPHHSSWSTMHTPHKDCQRLPKKRETPASSYPLRKTGTAPISSTLAMARFGPR